MRLRKLDRSARVWIGIGTAPDRTDGDTVSIVLLQMCSRVPRPIRINPIVFATERGAMTSVIKHGSAQFALFIRDPQYR